MPVISTSYEVESGFDTTLKSSISSTETASIIINQVPTVTSGVLLFDGSTAKEEWIGFGGRTDNGDGTATLTDVTRGLNLVGDTFTGSAARAFSHSGGVCKVTMVDYHSLFNLKANKDRDSNFTADQTFTKAIKFSGADARFELPRHTTAKRDALTSPNNGTKIWNTTTGQEERYDSGSWIAVISGGTFPNASTTAAGKLELATQSENNAGTPTGGTGAPLAATPDVNATSVQNSVWIYKTSTGSSNAYVLTLTPAVTAYVAGQCFIFNANFTNTSAATINVNGLGAKAIKKLNDQDLVSGDIESGQTVQIVYDGTNFQMVSQLAQAVPTDKLTVSSGVANTTTTDQYALAYNGNTRLDLADGNQAALNQEWLLAGIASGASTSGNAQAYFPFGPIVTVPAFTLAQRQSCRLWDGQINATSNVTTDNISATTDWRAQTFTPAAGEDNVSAFVLSLTKVSSPNGSSTVALYATSGGLPTGAALATCTTILNSAITTGDNTFSLATPYAVTPGTVYAIVWSSGISAGGSLAWNYQNTDVYATGQRCTSANSGTNWTAAATNDMRFTVRYRGIAGEPVYLSDTAGLLQLTPGTYNSQVGKAVSTTQIMLQERSKTVFGTISSSVTTTGSVDSEVTIGFRPSWIYVVSTWAYAPGTLAYPAGFFLATHTSSNNSAGLSFSAQRGATANAAIVSGVRESAPVAGINFTGKDTADTSVTVGTVSLSAMSANTVTINRNITTHPGGSVTLTTNFIAFQ
jgi:hypothetical protein